ncbi:rootletin-like [Bacillus rossius redtenbacheri]|uniref:rootletin-like n=1 Tax=Bacillus rossius redtenbacheri TaxID=93214 RepID=UPI002FDE7329
MAPWSAAQFLEEATVDVLRLLSQCHCVPMCAFGLSFLFLMFCKTRKHPGTTLPEVDVASAPSVRDAEGEEKLCRASSTHASILVERVSRRRGSAPDGPRGDERLVHTTSQSFDLARGVGEILVRISPGRRGDQSPGAGDPGEVTEISIVVGSGAPPEAWPQERPGLDAAATLGAPRESSFSDSCSGVSFVTTRGDLEDSGTCSCESSGRRGHEEPVGSGISEQFLDIPLRGRCSLSPEGHLTDPSVLLGLARIELGLAQSAGRDLRRDLLRLEERLEAQDSELLDSEMEKLALREQLSDAEYELSSSRAEAEKLRWELASSRAESEELRRELVSSRTEAEKLRRELASSRAEADKLRQELASSRDESEELWQDLASSRAEADELRREVASNQAESDELRREVASNQAESDELRLELASSRTEADELRRELASNREALE